MSTANFLNPRGSQTHMLQRKLRRPFHGKTTLWRLVKFWAGRIEAYFQPGTKDRAGVKYYI